MKWYIGLSAIAAAISPYPVRKDKEVVGSQEEIQTEGIVRLLIQPLLFLVFYSRRKGISCFNRKVGERIRGAIIAISDSNFLTIEGGRSENMIDFCHLYPMFLSGYLRHYISGFANEALPSEPHLRAGSWISGHLMCKIDLRNPSCHLLCLPSSIRIFVFTFSNREKYVIERGLKSILCHSNLIQLRCLCLQTLL